MGIVSDSMKKNTWILTSICITGGLTTVLLLTHFFHFFWFFVHCWLFLIFHFTNFLIRFRVLFNFFIWYSIFKIRKCFFCTFALRCWRNKIQIMFITIYFRNTSITIYKAFIKILILVFLELFCSLLWSFWTSFWE